MQLFSLQLHFYFCFLSIWRGKKRNCWIVSTVPLCGEVERFSGSLLSSVPFYCILFKSRHGVLWHNESTCQAYLWVMRSGGTVTIKSFRCSIFHGRVSLAWYWSGLKNVCTETVTASSLGNSVAFKICSAEAADKGQQHVFCIAKDHMGLYLSVFSVKLLWWKGPAGPQKQWV